MRSTSDGQDAGARMIRTAMCLILVAVSLVVVPDQQARAAEGSGRIVYGCGLRGLCTSEPDGTDRGLFVRTEFGDANTPAWSTDGLQVAWVDFQSSSGGNIYVAEAATGSVHQITEHGRASDPVWLPDGRVAYSRADENDLNFSQIWAVSPTSGIDQLLVDAGFCGHRTPSVSPDGSRIVFRGVWFETSRPCYENSPPTGIYYVDVGSTNAVPIVTQGDGLDPRQPDLSPDGTQLAFQSHDDLWVADLEGTDPVRLTSFGETPGDRYVYASYPRWSTDGTSIMFSRTDPDQGVEGLFAILPDGSASWRITDADDYSASDQQPCPDHVCAPVFVEERKVPRMVLDVDRYRGKGGQFVEAEVLLKPRPRFEDDAYINFALLKKTPAGFQPVADFDVRVESSQIIHNMALPRGTCKVVASFSGSSELEPRQVSSKKFSCRH